MDPALLREREAFKKKALATPRYICLQYALPFVARLLWFGWLIVGNGNSNILSLFPSAAADTIKLIYFLTHKQFVRSCPGMIEHNTLMKL